FPYTTLFRSQLLDDRLAGRSAGDRSGDRVGRGGGPESVLARERPYRLVVDGLLERRGDVPRVAGPGVVGRRATRHVEVADLAGDSGGAAVQPAADDRRDTDASADPHQHEVVDVACCTHLRLGDRREVHVVLERHRAAEVFAECLPEAVVPSRQVEREGDVPGGRVHDAGRTEDYPAYLRPRRLGPLGGLDDGRVHPPYRVVGAVRRDLDAGGDAPGDVRGGRHHLARADVDAHDVSAARHHGVELGVRSPAPGELADAGDELPFLQALNQL